MRDVNSLGVLHEVVEEVVAQLESFALLVGHEFKVVREDEARETALLRTTSGRRIRTGSDCQSAS